MYVISSDMIERVHKYREYKEVFIQQKRQVEKNLKSLGWLQASYKDVKGELSTLQEEFEEIQRELSEGEDKKFHRIREEKESVKSMKKEKFNNPLPSREIEFAEKQVYQSY